MVALIAQQSLPPRLYGLSKIHKPTHASQFCSISTTYSPTYNLAKLLQLDKELSLLTGKNISFVKISFDFIKKIQLHPDDNLVIFDVIYLFTKVPILTTVDIIKISKQISADLPFFLQFL